MFSRRNLQILILSLAIWILAIDVTIVTVALPEIGSELHATLADQQWVLDAFTVFSAGFILLGAGLAERFGRRRIFLYGLYGFIIGSAWAALSPTPSSLIAARAFMGIGVAFTLSASTSLTAVLFEGEVRRRAVATWSAAGGIALALGPVLGGLLLSAFSWGSVFWVNVPFAILAAVGARFLIPESRSDAAKRLDYLGEPRPHSDSRAWSSG